MYNYYSYWKKNRRESKPETQQVVSQTMDKIIKFRCDTELYKKYEELAKELNQNISKVARDVSQDFFLDRETIENKKDIEHFLLNS